MLPARSTILPTIYMVIYSSFCIMDNSPIGLSSAIMMDIDNIILAADTSS